MLGALRGALESLAPRLGRIGGLRPLANAQPVADATTKACVLDPAGESIAVVLCASDRSPALVARGVARAQEARGLLGSALGSVILEPLASGEVDGRSYVVLPFCRELRRSHLGWGWQRRWLTPYVLRWLHGAAEISSRRPGGDFATPLAHVAGHAGLPAQARQAAERALGRLESGAWTPRHALDHNDLWKNNIMLPPRGLLGPSPVYPFTIIDWVGANPRGYGVYDLLRFCKSMKLAPQRISRELAVHSAALGIERCDTWGHLMASLGWLGMHLEEFPPERYATAVASCCRTMLEADAAPQ